jgi:hypothetical protein
MGMGIGDAVGELSPEPDLPSFDLRSMLAKFSKRTGAIFSGPRKGGKGSYSSFDDDDDDDLNNLKHLEDDLTCGCCQIVTFSSNPSCPERAPISSRECSHTICRLCVQQCHLALMERVQTYQEWISCPICKAMNAFSSHNHLINRSLCSAISLMQRRQAFYEQQQQQQEEAEAKRQQQNQQQPSKTTRSL